MTKKKTTVALYARVSSDRQREERTIRSQIATNATYAKAHDYRIFERYQDDGISGAASIKERKGLRSLLDAAKEEHFKRVLIWDWNRLGRQDDFELLVQLSQSGISEIEETSTGALHDLNTFVGKLMSAVKTLMASEERKELAAKIKRGKDFKRKEGHWLGLPPYGYDYDKETKKFSFNKKEKALLERIFHMSLVEGKSVRAISDILYREGDRWRKGKIITSQIIRYCFRNECYCGSLFANRFRSVKGQRVERPRDEWIEYKLPTIISRKAHNQLLRKLKNLRRTGRPATPGRYLFQGLLKCGLCGARLRVHKTQWSNYYSCYNRSQARERERSTPDKSRCTLPYIRADKFDKGLFEYIIKQLANPEALKKAIAKQNFSPGRVEQLQKKKQKLQRGDQKIDKKIEQLMDNMEEGLLDLFHKRIWERKKQQAEIADDIAEVERQLKAAKEGDEKMKEIAGHIDEVGRHLWVKIFEKMFELGPVYQRRVIEALFGSLSTDVEVKPSKYKKSSPFGSGVTATWKPKLNFDLVASIAERAKLGESLKSAFDHSFNAREQAAKKVVAKARGKGDHIETNMEFGPCDPPWSTSEKAPLLRSPRRNLPPA